jgi:hypothetical protein
LALKTDANTAIAGATKTKITYDSKGLVTSGADATTADISASTDKNYVTDAQLVIIGNTSGTNSGDQTLIGLGGVPTGRNITINGTTQDLSADRTFTITNITGNAGTVTTNANLIGPIASTGNTTSVTSQTGIGSKFVMDTSPILITPEIGAATGTSLVLTGNVTTKHLVGVTGTPLVAFGTGAGSTPTGTNITGKDLGGYIDFTTGGTAPAAGEIIATISFNTAYVTAPSAIILSAGTDQAGLDMNRVYVNNITTTSFEIRTTSTAISGGIYRYYFMVVE